MTVSTKLSLLVSGLLTALYFVNIFCLEMKGDIVRKKKLFCAGKQIFECQM